VSTFLTVPEVASRLQVHESTVAALIRTGQLEGFNASRNAASGKPRWRVTQDALERFIQSRTPQSVNPQKQRRSKKPDSIPRHV
jgi:excisionase family DNA binding protein